MNVVVFPNPTDGQVKLAFEKTLKEALVTLYDEAGKRILTQQINGLNSVDLNIESCASGLYYVLIQSEDKRAIHKLIKK